MKFYVKRKNIFLVVIRKLETCSRNWSALLVGISFLIIMGIVMNSCVKLVEVDPPYTSVNSDNLYSNESKAISVVTGIYSLMSNSPIFSGSTGISVLTGLSSDELTLYSGVSSESFISYYRNDLISNPVAQFGSEFWSPFYNLIYRCNDVLAGVQASTLNQSIKRQLVGETKFLRAFFYFYLINLYGDVPLAITADYKVNQLLKRSATTEVYNQIIQDLVEAKELLSNSFLDPTLNKITSERIRPTRWSAIALLARVYLYTKNWDKAIEESSLIIENSGMFHLVPLNEVFNKNSREAIWQIQPTVSNRNTAEGLTYLIPPSGPSNTVTNPVYLSGQLLNSFEEGDQRKVLGNWINSITVNGHTYFYPYKYKIGAVPSVITSASEYTEYLMVFRLAEQYLIRAEARANKNLFEDALSDLNKIRNRSNLNDTTAVGNLELINLIHHEHQVEFFTEWGHRWLELKRTGKVEEVMTSVTPIKTLGIIPWRSYQQLYPLPFAEIERAPNITQNPGY